MNREKVISSVLGIDAIIKIGKNIVFGKNVRIFSDNVIIEDNVIIKANTIISSDQVFIGKNTKIGKNNNITTPQLFSIKENSVMMNNNNITCRSFVAEDYLFMMNNIEIGGGGCRNRDSHVKIGKYVMLCDRVMLNPSRQITIGHNVGIGSEVNIWTHGAYLQVLRGFPSEEGSVTIGNNVWIPSRVQILPNVIIGNNIVIALNSVVNKHLPDGCLAGGIPVKIIKEDLYPKEKWDEHKINEIIYDYLYQLEWKIPDIKIDIQITHPYVILMKLNNKELYYFDLLNFTIVGEHIDHEVVQDFRDYLRRRGIKIYDGTPFKTITADEFKKYEGWTI